MIMRARSGFARTKENLSPKANIQQKDKIDLDIKYDVLRRSIKKGIQNYADYIYTIYEFKNNFIDVPDEPVAEEDKKWVAIYDALKNGGDGFEYSQLLYCFEKFEWKETSIN